MVGRLVRKGKASLLRAMGMCPIWLRLGSRSGVSAAVPGIPIGCSRESGGDVPTRVMSSVGGERLGGEVGELKPVLAGGAT